MEQLAKLLDIGDCFDGRFNLFAWRAKNTRPEFEDCLMGETDLRFVPDASANRLDHRIDLSLFRLIRLESLSNALPMLLFRFRPPPGRPGNHDPQ
jgi:hypothetical protein